MKVWVICRRSMGVLVFVDVCATRLKARSAIKRLRRKNPGAKKHTYVAKQRVVA